jgi:hypothetical protein
VPASVPTFGPDGDKHYRWRTAQRRATEQLRVWQIEAGKILRIVYLDPAIAICLEEEFDVVVQTDVEAQRDINDINVARITIVIAVSNTERELPATQR